MLSISSGTAPSPPPAPCPFPPAVPGEERGEGAPNVSPPAAPVSRGPSAPHTAVSCSALDSSFFLFILQKPWSPQKQAKVNWGIPRSRRGVGTPQETWTGTGRGGEIRAAPAGALQGMHKWDRSPKSPDWNQARANPSPSPL